MFGMPKSARCYTSPAICGAARDDKAPSTPASKIGNSIAKLTERGPRPLKLNASETSTGDSKLCCTTAPSEN